MRGHGDHFTGSIGQLSFPKLASKKAAWQAVFSSQDRSGVIAQVSDGSASVPSMGDDRDEAPEERPATWENEVVGEAKELLGRAIGDKELAEEGEEQVEIAHEVREEYDEHKDRD